MGETINTNMPTIGIKQYYVKGTNGSSVVRVAIDPHSSTTSQTSTGSGSGVLISIGTKNLTSNAAITNAIHQAVNNISPQAADVLVKDSTENILSTPEEAVMAASINAPNEEVMGLLM